MPTLVVSAKQCPRGSCRDGQVRKKTTCTHVGEERGKSWYTEDVFKHSTKIIIRANI